VWNALVIYVPLQISKEEIHLPYHFQPISDTPLHSSINYPPRLLLTVDSCDSGRPLRDLECKLEVKGTVERCEFMLKMKAPSASEGIFIDNRDVTITSLLSMVYLTLFEEISTSRNWKVLINGWTCTVCQSYTGRSLAKKGPWALYLTLSPDKGVGGYL